MKPTHALTARLGRPLLALLLTLALGQCATTKAGFKGDPEAAEVEKRLLDIDQALDEDDARGAAGKVRSLEDYLRDNRKVLELHPEASMIFNRVDSAKRRLRDVEARVAEREAADAKADAEAQVRRPLVEAAEIAEKINSGEPTAEDVVALRRAMDSAQSELNDARRDGRLEIGGEFANEIEARLKALQDTANHAERLAKAVSARNELREALRAVGLAEGRATAVEKLGDYESAQTKLTACQERVAGLLKEDPNLGSTTFALDDKTKSIRLKDIARRCKKEEKALSKLVKEAKKAKKKADAIAAFASDKSADQKKVLEKWGRKPDISWQKKAKLIWTFVDKRQVKKGRRTRTVKILHEYHFDKVGTLIDENERKR